MPYNFPGLSHSPCPWKLLRGEYCWPEEGEEDLHSVQLVCHQEDLPAAGLQVHSVLIIFLSMQSIYRQSSQ